MEVRAGGPAPRREPAVTDLVLHLDAEVAVVRKPAGILTVPFERDDRDTLLALARRGRPPDRGRPGEGHPARRAASGQGDLGAGGLRPHHPRAAASPGAARRAHRAPALLRPRPRRRRGRRLRDAVRARPRRRSARLLGRIPAARRRRPPRRPARRSPGSRSWSGSPGPPWWPASSRPAASTRSASISPRPGIRWWGRRSTSATSAGLSSRPRGPCSTRRCSASRTRARAKAALRGAAAGGLRAGAGAVAAHRKTVEGALPFEASPWPLHFVERYIVPILSAALRSSFSLWRGIEGELRRQDPRSKASRGEPNYPSHRTRETRRRFLHESPAPGSPLRLPTAAPQPRASPCWRR